MAFTVQRCAALLVASHLLGRPSLRGMHGDFMALDSRLGLHLAHHWFAAGAPAAHQADQQTPALTPVERQLSTETRTSNNNSSFGKENSGIPEDVAAAGNGWFKRGGGANLKVKQLGETIKISGEGQEGMLCGYLDKNFVSKYGKKSKVQWHKRWFSLDLDRRILYYYKNAVRPQVWQFGRCNF